jgi:cytochrome P450
MIDAQDDESGTGLTDQEVRDQVVSLVAAGHDTTRAGIGWTRHAVATHPDVAARLVDEVEIVIWTRQTLPPSSLPGLSSML